MWPPLDISLLNHLQSSILGFYHVQIWQAKIQLYVLAMTGVAVCPAEVVREKGKRWACISPPTLLQSNLWRYPERSLSNWTWLTRPQEIWLQLKCKETIFFFLISTVFWTFWTQVFSQGFSRITLITVSSASAVYTDFPCGRFHTVSLSSLFYR